MLSFAALKHTKLSSIFRFFIEFVYKIRNIVMKNFRWIIALCLSVFVIIFAEGQIVGGASYYSNRFHGGRTTSGIRYHKDSLTCAHRTLPFGTYVKVRNLRNDKEVVVKVTDRGPHVRGRIIDLSYAAAKQLDFVSRGLARVEITVLDEKPTVIPVDSMRADSVKMNLPLPLQNDTILLRRDNTRLDVKFLRKMETYLLQEDKRRLFQSLAVQKNKE